MATINEKEENSNAGVSRNPKSDGRAIFPVIPAKAGIHELSPVHALYHWIPAFAGMTVVDAILTPNIYALCADVPNKDSTLRPGLRPEEVAPAAQSQKVTLAFFMLTNTIV